MSLEIRRVHPSEYEKAGEVTAEAYREFAPKDLNGCHTPAPWFTDYLDELADIRGRASRTIVLVALEAGEIVATITLEFNGRVDPDEAPPPADEMHIRMLGVLPAARGRGVARRLMETGMELARQHGRLHITLHTTELMTAAQKLYESLGFERISDQILESGMHFYKYGLMLQPVGSHA